LAGISQPRRQRLHLTAADAIETLHPRETGAHAAEVAHHLVAAGSLPDRQRVVSYLVLAGREALHSAAYEEARRHLTGALSHQDGDLRGRAELRLDLATAERGLGNWDQAFAHWNQAVSLFSDMGDCEATGNAFFQMFEGMLWSGRQREAVEIAERGLEGLTEACAGHVYLLAARGLVRSLGGKYDAAREAFAQAHCAASALGDQKLVARVLAYQSICNFYYLDLQGALDSGRQSAALGETAGALWSRLIGLSRQQVALHHLGRNEEAAVVGAELEPIAHKLSHMAVLSFSIWTQAWTEFGKEPDFARLEKRLAEDLEISRKARIPLLLAPTLAQMSVVYFLRGNRPAALDYAQEARKVSPFPVMLGFGSGALFRQMAYAGDRRGALALLD